MLAITIGYTSNDRLAAPTVIYCGSSVDEAQTAGSNPPPGIVRTEFFRNPLASRRRFFPASPPAPPVTESQVTESPPETPPEPPADPPADTLLLEEPTPPPPKKPK